jgi:hypothetical protein
MILSALLEEQISDHFYAIFYVIVNELNIIGFTLNKASGKESR